MTLMEHVERYLALKRALGLSYAEQAQLLRAYAAHADARGDRRVVGATVLHWADRTSSKRQARKRLGVLRGFAAALHAEDPRHDVPSPDYFGKRETRRKPPNLLSMQQIGQIMDAALALPPAGSITPLTFRCMLGLLASTGLRRREAINLLLTDVTPDGLLIRNAKFGGNRLVPLHDSVRRAIDEYLTVRLRTDSRDEHLFILSTGRSASPHYLTGTYIKLARATGVRGGSRRTRAEAARSAPRVRRARTGTPGIHGPQRHRAAHAGAVDVPGSRQRGKHLLVS